MSLSVCLIVSNTSNSLFFDYRHQFWLIFMEFRVSLQLNGEIYSPVINVVLCATIVRLEIVHFLYINSIAT